MEEPISFEGTAVLKSAILAVSAVTENITASGVLYHSFFAITNGGQVEVSSVFLWDRDEATAKRLEFLQLIDWL